MKNQDKKVVSFSKEKQKLLINKRYMKLLDRIVEKIIDNVFYKEKAEDD